MTMCCFSFFRRAVFFLTLSLIPSVALSQLTFPEFSLSSRDIDPFYAVVDIVTTRGNLPDSTRVDCYYRLSNELLNFIKVDDQYIGHFELSLVITDKDGFQMLGETIRDSVVVKEERETHTMDYSMAHLYTTFLPPGKYTFELKLLDIESTRQRDIARSFIVPDYFKDALSVSDIQFAGLITSEPVISGLTRNGWTIIPNLTRSYGEEQNELYVYYEVYTDAQEVTNKSLTATYKIKSPTGSLLVNEQQELEREGNTGRYSCRFDTRNFSQGVYTFEIEIRDNDVKKTAKTRGEFNINWQYLLPLTSAKNYKEIVDQLQLIANTDEMKELKKLTDANTPEQQNALTTFWKRRDPTPGTEQNENMITYYRRVAYANRHFTNGLGKGWRSDQGRIYILLGPPDEVERFSFEQDTRPYQVWHYNHISRRFMFVDFDGYGRYELYRVY